MIKTATEYILTEDGKTSFQKQCVVCKNKNEYSTRTKPVLCPHCGSKYWDKPSDERNIFLLQDEYIEKNRPKAILAEMYLLLKKYSKNIIKHRIKNSYRMSKFDLEEKSTDLANTVIKKYLENDNMQVHSSFGGYLLRISSGILYANQKEEQHDSLNQKIDERNELEDKLGSLGAHTAVSNSQTLMRGADEEFFAKDNSSFLEMMNIIDKIFRTIKTTDDLKSSGILYLVAFRNKLNKKSDIFMNKFYSILAGNSIKDDIKNTELVLYRYLKEKMYVQ